jgi:hypothetical protein
LIDTRLALKLLVLICSRWRAPTRKQVQAAFDDVLKAGQERVSEPRMKRKLMNDVVPQKHYSITTSAQSQMQGAVVACWQDADV